MAREIGFQQKGTTILIDDEPFDWDLDESSIDEANQHCGSPHFMRAIHGDIMRHFLSSLSEVLGFEPTIKQVNEALKRGFISR